MDFSIRRFHSPDYDGVTALWRKAGLSFKPRGRDRRETLTQEMKGGQGCLYLAEGEGKLLGTVLVTHDGRKGWINRLAVDPDFRRRGVARRLLKEAEEFLKERGIDIFACLIEAGNEDSLRFFQDSGYRDFPGIHYLTRRLREEV